MRRLTRLFGRGAQRDSANDSTEVTAVTATPSPAAAAAAPAAAASRNAFSLLGKRPAPRRPRRPQRAKGAAESKPLGTPSNTSRTWTRRIPQRARYVADTVVCMWCPKPSLRASTCSCAKAYGPWLVPRLAMVAPAPVKVRRASFRYIMHACIRVLWL